MCASWGVGRLRRPHEPLQCAPVWGCGGGFAAPTNHCLVEQVGGFAADLLYQESTVSTFDMTHWWRTRKRGLPVLKKETPWKVARKFSATARTRFWWHFRSACC